MLCGAGLILDGQAKFLGRYVQSNTLTEFFFGI